MNKFVLYLSSSIRITDLGPACDHYVATASLSNMRQYLSRPQIHNIYKVDHSDSRDTPNTLHKAAVIALYHSHNNKL